jgi:tetratricopeptide (TPR) repeat protein
MINDLYLRNTATGTTEGEKFLAQALGEFHQGRFEAAEELCAKALRASQNFAEAFNLLAAIAVQLGAPERAAAMLARAAEMAPAQREYRHNLGNVLKSLGRFDEAVSCFRQALRIEPDAADSAFELAVTLSDAGRHDEAGPLFRALAAAMPNVADAYHRLGIAAICRGERSLALELTRRALACRPDFTDAHTNLAVMLLDGEEPAQAFRHFRLAVETRPDDPVLYANLANYMRDLGRMGEEARLLAHALSLTPWDLDLHYSLAASSTFVPGDFRLVMLEEMAARESRLDSRSRLNLHFALAKAFEDLGQPDRSFQHQLSGNAVKRAAIQYDEAKMLDSFGRIKRVFSPDMLKRLPRAAVSSELPIFVLGMPRSGSSLVEQILASHPQAVGAGELPDLPTLARDLGPDQGPFFPEFVERMGAADLQALGDAYVSGLRRRDARALRIVDKQPENFRLIGLIHHCLPGAKIVHTRRDAVDSCLSIYSKLFSAEMGYAYDLGEIGRYWRAYEDLMAHWRAVLPEGSFLDIDYEALVADQEGQTRRLLEFCGLEWDEACLQFHRTDRPVRTASAAQVRKPLYSSAVGRWRPRPEQLAPLLEGLGRFTPPR